MNAPLPTQHSISDALRQVAMIAEISTSALGMSRTDKDASKKTERDHASKEGSARVVVQRFNGADDEIRAIHEIHKAAHENLRNNTMAWGKRRLLPNANFMRWNARHEDLVLEHQKAVDVLLANADVILAKAAQNLGSFNVDLPSKQEMATAFSLTKAMEPIPDGKQFGSFGGQNPGLVDELDAQLRYQFERNMEASFTAATQDAAARLAGPLSKMVERLEAYNKRETDIANGRDAGREGYFRDSLVQNVQDMTAVFANMNVLNDPILADIAKKAEVFNRITPETLRKGSNEARERLAKHAAGIVEELNGFLSR